MIAAEDGYYTAQYILALGYKNMYHDEEQAWIWMFRSANHGFKGVWCEILCWLRQHDSTASSVSFDSCLELLWENNKKLFSW